MEDIKLFISCHKEDVRIPSGNDLLYPIQVGTALADKRFPGMLHDDEGDNISVKNREYCELTGQYWAWKHVRADYFGFLHYRRYFNFSGKELPITHAPFIFGEVVRPSNRKTYLKEICFDPDTIASTVERYDFIVPVPIPSPGGETVYEQYCASEGHHREDIDAVRKIVATEHPAYLDALDAYFNSREIICCNMFTVKDEFFQQYCEWLFDILGRFEQVRDISDYSPVERRVVGYLAERLCGVYFTYLAERGAKGGNLQRVYFKDVSGQGTLSRVVSRIRK